MDLSFLSFLNGPIGGALIGSVVTFVLLRSHQREQDKRKELGALRDARRERLTSAYARALTFAYDARTAILAAKIVRNDGTRNTDAIKPLMSQIAAIRAPLVLEREEIVLQHLVRVLTPISEAIREVQLEPMNMVRVDACLNQAAEHLPELESVMQESLVALDVTTDVLVRSNKR